MLLRLNQYFFGIIVFSLQTAFIATLAYSLVLFVFLTGGQIEKHDPWGLLVGTSGLVFAASLPSCALAFLLSICFKRKLARFTIRHESTFILILAAIPAIISSIVLLHSAFSLLNVVVYIASVLSVYIGSFVYRSTWNTLNRIIFDK